MLNDDVARDVDGGGFTFQSFSGSITIRDSDTGKVIIMPRVKGEGETSAVQGLAVCGLILSLTGTYVFLAGSGWTTYEPVAPIRRLSPNVTGAITPVA